MLISNIIHFKAENITQDGKRAITYSPNTQRASDIILNVNQH